MNATKLITAAIAGTTFMTLYSYLVSRQEKQQYVEPVLLNKLLNSKRTNEEHQRHPSGWLAHYGTGLFFVLSYALLWKRALQKPTVLKALALGTSNGALAILIWKAAFISHPAPPYNNRRGYYRQLFIAHIVFSSFALLGYKLPGYLQNTNQQ